MQPWGVSPVFDTLLSCPGWWLRQTLCVSLCLWGPSEPFPEEEEEEASCRRGAVGLGDRQELGHHSRHGALGTHRQPPRAVRGQNAATTATRWGGTSEGSPHRPETPLQAL